MKLDNNVLFVSHIDLDGFMPIVLNQFFNIEYGKEINTNYGEELEVSELSNYKNVIYVDFTPCENARKVIDDNKINCIVIDHHESQYEEISNWCKDLDYVEYIYDNDRSGTLIYYDWLLSLGYKGNNVTDYLSKVVSIYDLFQKDNELWEVADNLNRLLYSSGKYYLTDKKECFSFFISTMLWKCQNAESFFFSKLELSKIMVDKKKEDDIFLNLVNNAKSELSTRQDEKGDYFCVFKCKSKISAICFKLLEKYKKLSYVICINDYDVDKPKISVRSREDFDCLSLEGVKGHKNAGGYENPTREIVEQLWNKDIYSFKRLS